MVTKSFPLLSGFLLMLAVFFSNCSRDTTVLAPADLPTDAVVFEDGFGPGVQYQSFGDARLDAIEIVADELFNNQRTLKVTVPSDGYQYGTYAGGALVAAGGRNLTGYTALTFWAKANIDAKLNVAGYGNDNTGFSKYTAQRTNLPLRPIWTKYIIPIPDPQKLINEKGLFFFAAANVNGAGFHFWVASVKFEALGTLAHPVCVLPSKTVDRIEGDTIKIDNPTVAFNLNGVDITVQATASYLTYASTDSTVASVSTHGVVTAKAPGTATITARVGSTPVTGSIIVNTKANAGPTFNAPFPLVSSTKVISLFSDSYTNVQVDTWSASWSTGTVKDTALFGNKVKLFSGLGFVGIDFSKHQIDASAMTHFHMDVWTVYPTALPAKFKVKLVDFGPNGVSGGGDDNEQELTFTAATTPALKTGSWMSIDLSLAEFLLTSKANLAQIILSGDLKTIWVDNVYLYQGAGGSTLPSTPAPVPTYPSANVISLFSDSYTNHPVDNDLWAAYWQYSTSVVTNKVIAGNNVKLYTTLNFAGIEFTGANMLDVSAMTHFRMDIWTPNTVASPSAFKILLVDFGANGAYGGGDDSQHELTFTASSSPALASGSWITLDIPLSSFTGLVNKNHLAQLVISGAGDIKTVWVDNVLFHK